MKLGYFLISLLFATVEKVLSANRGDACQVGSSDCTQANTVCQPPMSSTCTSGKCECDAHYNWDSVDSKCKLKRYPRDKCTSSDSYCKSGSSCMSGTCSCTGTDTYNSVNNMCVPTAKKAVGEVCTGSDAGDCYEGIAGSVECKIPTGSSGSQKNCECKSGYITEAKKCRKPHFGESCTTTVGCESRFPNIVSQDASMVTETCISNTCNCESTYTKKNIREYGMRAEFCVAPLTSGTAVGIGTACTNTNQCSTGFCFECPEATADKCVADNV